MEKFKVGDMVIQSEKIYEKCFIWVAEVIRIEYKTNSSKILFIETKFERIPILELMELIDIKVKSGELQSNNRTYCTQYIKNYVDEAKDDWKILNKDDLKNKRCSAYKYLIP